MVARKGTMQPNRVTFYSLTVFVNLRSRTFCDRRTLPWGLGLAAVAAVGLAGCGGGSKSASAHMSTATRAALCSSAQRELPEVREAIEHNHEAVRGSQETTIQKRMVTAFAARLRGLERTVDNPFQREELAKDINSKLRWLQGRLASGEGLVEVTRLSAGEELSRIGQNLEAICR